VIGLLIALVATLAFLVGLSLQGGISRSESAVQIITVVVTAPPAPTTADQPGAYPAPSVPDSPPAAHPSQVAAIPTSIEAPVFAPIRPTLAQERGFAAPIEPTATTEAAFQIAPANAQPAPTVLGAEPQAAPTLVAAPQPTVAVLPTEQVAPTAAAPRAVAADRSSGEPAAPTSVASAAHAIQGSTIWNADQGPVVLRGSVEIPRGATLTIREGTEIQLPRGASFIVNGNLFVLGTADRPVRFVAAIPDRTQRWEAIFARPGSSVVLNNAELLNGGAGGTLIGAELSDLKLRSIRIIGNGGQIRAVDSRVEMREIEMRENEIPYGAAIDVTFSRGGTFTLVNSRIQRNFLTTGTAPVLVTNQSFSQPTTLEITGNLLVGQDGPNLQLFTNAQMQGNVTCNAMIGGANGLSLRSDAPPNLSPMINLRDNVIEGHTPPIIDFYLEFGIGRGATSDLPLGMANNWWEVANGPFDPDRNNAGRGEAVGDTISFSPWLTQRPACAPRL
jgi:hypothetical protein